MNYPPRLAHLVTRAVAIAKVLPTYAEAHHVDDEEARERLEKALAGRLHERLLEATWEALTAKTQRLDDDGLLEKVAQTLGDRPLRPGRLAKLGPAWSAFLVLADLEAGIASDMARRVLETEEGQKKSREGLAEVGRYLAAELTRGR